MFVLLLRLLLLYGLDLHPLSCAAGYVLKVNGSE
jgi:hypothetical protein